MNGKGVAIDGYPRFDTPWLHADFEARQYVITDDDASLRLDFDTTTRTVD